MSEHNKQHHGRSPNPGPDEPDRTLPGEPDAGLDSVSAAEDAREISRMLDEFEGYDRPVPRRQSKQNGGGEQS